MSSNYKQMGGKIDPLYRTPLEGRGFLNTQSKLHGGKGMNRGRQTHTAQYVSPKMAGISLVANTTFSGSNDETSGIGLRWSNKSFLVFGDYITGQTSSPDAIIDGGDATVGGIQDCTTALGCTTEAAYKIGGMFTAKAFSVALQYENAADRAGADFIFAAGTWNINKNNALILTMGQADVSEATGVDSLDRQGYALAYNHNISKMTNVYVGYGATSNDFSITDVPIGDIADTLGGDESMFTVGIRKKF